MTTHLQFFMGLALLLQQALIKDLLLILESRRKILLCCKKLNYGSSKSGGETSTDSGLGMNTLSSNRLLEPESPMSRKASSGHYHQAFDQKHPHQIPQPQQHQQQHQQSEMENDLSQTQVTQSSPKPIPEKRKGAGSSSEKVLDAKTLRRLAQNREAAKKSRLRKKAYVQQLESSRIKLSQLEQDLQRARSQGLFLAGGGGSCGTISPGAAMFDMEYGRWLDDDHRHMSELRTGLQAHLQDSDLRIIVDGYIAHYDEIFQLKGVAAKSDVFHLITGMWTTPAERCFLWMGGFRPSELIKPPTLLTTGRGGPFPGIGTATTVAHRNHC
ncbi:hypothetical protein CsSME_00040432 [Camellia sinensis var. sinensis]